MSQPTRHPPVHPLAIHHLNLVRPRAILTRKHLPLTSWEAHQAINPFAICPWLVITLPLQTFGLIQPIDPNQNTFSECQNVMMAIDCNWFAGFCSPPGPLLPQCIPLPTGSNSLCNAHVSLSRSAIHFALQSLPTSPLLLPTTANGGSNFFPTQQQPVYYYPSPPQIYNQPPDNYKPAAVDQDHRRDPNSGLGLHYDYQNDSQQVGASTVQPRHPVYYNPAYGYGPPDNQYLRYPQPPAMFSPSQSPPPETSPYRPVHFQPQNEVLFSPPPAGDHPLNHTLGHGPPELARGHLAQSVLHDAAYNRPAPPPGQRQDGPRSRPSAPRNHFASTSYPQ